MDRLTVKDEESNYILKRTVIEETIEGFKGEAVEKLAKFENFHEELIKEQEDISIELEKLRNEEKNKTVKFKELMIKKLTNVNILILLKRRGIEK